MNVFLGVVSKGDKIGPDLIQTIQSMASRSLPFRGMPYRSQVWQSESGKVALLTWDNDPAGEDGPPLIHSEGPYALTVSGYVFEPDIRGLGPLMRRIDPAGDPRARVADLGGTFVIACADGSSDSIRAWNTLIPMQSAYWAETGKYTLVGTRGLLVHLVAKEADYPRYNLPALVPLISYGYFANDMTPYEGVEILPMNSEIAVSARGAAVRSIDGSEARIGQGDAEPDEAFYDQFTDVFLNGLRYVKGGADELVLGLSGGKDSRVVAAGLKTIGADFLSRTGGPHGHPDVILGRRIAEVLDIPHEHTQPISDEAVAQKEITVDLLPRTIDVLFLTDAQANNWPRFPRSDRFDPVGHIVGQGGEFYRGGYLKDAANRRGLDRAKMHKLINDKYMRFPECFQDAFISRYQQYMADWIASQPSSMLPSDILERLFAVTYGWRWAPPRFGARYSQSPTFYPLCDGKLLRLNYQVRRDYRLNDQLGYALLERLAPALIDVPFHKWRWWFEEDGPRDGDVEGWKRRAPLVRDKYSQAAVNWQHEVGTDLREEFYEQVFRNTKADDLFGILKRDALERLFNSIDLLNTRAARFMWHVYTASVMLSNDWLLPVSPSRPATVRCDVAWHRVNRRIVTIMPGRRRAVRSYADRRLDQCFRGISKHVDAAAASLRSDSKADRQEALRPILSQFEQAAKDTVRNYLAKLAGPLENIRATHGIAAERWRQHLGTIGLPGGNGQGAVTGVSLRDLLEPATEEAKIPSRYTMHLGPEIEERIHEIATAGSADGPARKRVMDYLGSLKVRLLAEAEGGILAGIRDLENDVLDALHVTVRPAEPRSRVATAVVQHLSREETDALDRFWYRQMEGRPFVGRILRRYQASGPKLARMIQSRPRIRWLVSRLTKTFAAILKRTPR